MQNIIPSYFHLLPTEINETIISYIKSIDLLEKLYNNYYLFYKIIGNINLWKRLIKTKENLEVIYDEIEVTNWNPSINDLINLWYNITDEKFLYSHHQDIQLREKFKKNYPKLYQRIKSFNLHPWIFSRHNFFSKFNYQSIINIIPSLNKGGPYFYSDIMLNFIQTGDLPKDYIYDGIVYNLLYPNAYIIFGIFFHPNFNLDIQTEKFLFDILNMAFNINYDIYDKMFRMIGYDKLIKVVKNNFNLYRVLSVSINNDIMNGIYKGISILEFLFDLKQRSEKS